MNTPLVNLLRIAVTNKTIYRIDEVCLRFVMSIGKVLLNQTDYIKIC